MKKIVVNKESDLEKLFNSLNYNEFIKRQLFMDSLRELNSLSLNIKVKDISDVFDNLTTNSIKEYGNNSSIFMLFNYSWKGHSSS